MMQYFTRPISCILMGLGALFLLSFSGKAHAWTSAHLFNVDVEVTVSAAGSSTVTTRARFVVEGGYFHGFDMVNLPNGRLDKESGIAILDDKRTMPIHFKRVKGGRIRVLLDDDRYIRKGGITFQVVHHIDLAQSNAIRAQGDQVTLDFTPLVWAVGMDSMVLNIVLPEGHSNIQVDSDVSKDYVVNINKGTISAVKYRPVKWYPMRLVAQFHAPMFKKSHNKEKTSTAPSESSPSKAVFARIDEKTEAIPQGKWPPTIFALLGFIALFFKAKHVLSASKQVGIRAQFAFLTHTKLSLRFGLALVALTIGLGVQWAGHLAASIPALGTVAALFVMRRQKGPTSPEAGGTWHQLTPEESNTLNQELKAYQQERCSLLDATTWQGMMTFSIFAASLALSIATQIGQSNHVWLTGINGLIFAIPAWFGSIRSELPVNPMLEGFHTLRKWEHSLSKLLGTRLPGSEPAFFVRADAGKILEVRIKASPEVAGLRSVEVACEIYRMGTLYRTRCAFMFRLDPGMPISEKLSSCKGAADHHLTPDLQEEIVVLRNRRGRNRTQLSTLRAALATVKG